MQLEIKIDPMSIPIREVSIQYEQSLLEYILLLCQEEGFVLLLDSSLKKAHFLA
jgi:hypothetical protein